MASPKKSKTRGKIARRNAVYREARIANLVNLVEIAYRPIADNCCPLGPASLCEHVYQHAAAVREFLSRAAPIPRESVASPNFEELLWIQSCALRHLEQAAEGAEWTLKPSELSSLDPNFEFVIQPLFRPYGLGFTASNLKAQFLWTLAHLLGGAYGERISRCAEPGCTKIIVRRKRGTYCTEHRTGKERARRHREKLKNDLSLAERRESRHCRYERRKGKPAKKRAVRSDELAREAVEANRRVDS